MSTLTPEERATEILIKAGFINPTQYEIETAMKVYDAGRSAGLEEAAEIAENHRD